MYFKVFLIVILYNEVHKLKKRDNGFKIVF